MVQIRALSGQQGKKRVIITLISIIAVIGLIVLGVWLRYAGQDEPAVTQDSSNQDDTRELQYKDLRTDGDRSGVRLVTIEGISHLGDIGDKMKLFLEQEVGAMRELQSGDMWQQFFIIDRVYGDYAAGWANTAEADVIWGPKGGDGEIEIVATAQNVGFVCEELTSNRVPSELVDGECYDAGDTEEGEQPKKYPRD